MKDTIAALSTMLVHKVTVIMMCTKIGAGADVLFRMRTTERSNSLLPDLSEHLFLIYLFIRMQSAKRISISSEAGRPSAIAT